jgi:glucose/arabinose dehydrogenase
MRNVSIGLLLSLAAMGCGGDSKGSADGGATADANPNAPDADPNAPDARPNAPDAAPACSNTPVDGVPTLDVETVASGFTAPVVAVYPPGEQRLFVLDKVGSLFIVENGGPKDPAFLDISNLVRQGYNERGLLGVAFHPQYATNKRFYVYYTALPSGDLTIAEYTASSADDGNAASGKVLLTIPHSQNPNHNGGWMQFGPDGYLYVSTGDGGGGGDQPNNSQNTNILLGKILRLDVNTAGSIKIPDGNPFKGMANKKGEIWSYGVRNPWRNSFDRKTGDLYIGDVGQDYSEEVDVQLHGAAGGQNYGWHVMESDTCYNDNDVHNPLPNCDKSGKILPIYHYEHNGGAAAITGGYVYRGCRMPALQGTYFFGDTSQGFIRSLKWDGAAGATDVTNYPQFAGGAKIIPYSFAEDLEGELLVCDAKTGSVLRFIPKP